MKCSDFKRFFAVMLLGGVLWGVVFLFVVFSKVNYVEVKAKALMNAENKVVELLHKAREKTTVQKEVLVPFNIPKGHGVFKSYMDFRTITSPSSKQYALQQEAETGDFGIRYYNGLPMIAVAERFGLSGEILKIKFSSGQEGYFIIGDIKAGTDFAHPDGSVVEFIVDSGLIPNEVRLMGSFDSVYSGSIVEISKVVKEEIKR